MTPTIIQVPVDLIDPHPSNPRRDLGDLTELTDSVREHGILQHLIVVLNPDSEPDPEYDGIPSRYRVVIGHRRLAAARMAGLTEVPAQLADDLTAAEQLQIMLLENVQRADLTPIEEAEGYQGLLDLGLKVTMVAKRTGRTRKTVEARLQLLTLPETAREKVHARQLSLEDAAVLAEFDDDPEVQARLLKAAGGPNFNWTVSVARGDRRDAAARKPIVDQLVALGFAHMTTDQKHSRRSRMQRVAFFDHVSEIGEADEYPDGALIYEYTGATVELWTPLKDADDRDQKDAESERDRLKAEVAQKRAEIEQSIELRDAFVEGVLSRKLTSKERQAITAHAAEALLLENLGTLWDIDRWLDLVEDDLENVNWSTWLERWPNAVGEHVLLASIHAARRYLGWRDPGMVSYFRLLTDLGYQVSDVEHSRLQPDEEGEQ